MQRTPTIGIVADDLTSATDGAAPFLHRGYDPVILRSSCTVPEADVVALDTGSRAASKEAAAIATSGAIAALANSRFLFKTIDSTLRGWIREEIAAAFGTSRRTRLIVAPAFPDAGRTTVNGFQHVHGVPVHESAYALDPVNPVRTSSIADLVLGLGLPVDVFPQDASGDGLRAMRRSAVTILDSDNQSDLNRLVAQVPDPGDVLWVGSPGLALALAARLSPTGNGTPKRKRSSRVLVVAGSANPSTHVQCDILATNGIPVEMRWAGRSKDEDVFCLRAPIERRGDAAQVLEALVGEAGSALSRGTYNAVIATGGETMAAILDRIGIDRFQLIGELEPGFPIGQATTGAGMPLTIAMKAGGFGSPASLLAAVRCLLGRSETADA